VNRLRVGGTLDLKPSLAFGSDEPRATTLFETPPREFVFVRDRISVAKAYPHWIKARKACSRLVKNLSG
jgi:hypothetical protein